MTKMRRGMEHVNETRSNWMRERKEVHGNHEDNGTIGWQKFVYDERDTTKLQFRNTEILCHVALIEQ